jgi:TonB-dependent SusC/RagA subfamily outer membrane receptor
VLIFLDGKPVPSMEDLEDQFGVKPDDIESINVLKGEAAIEKYGQDGTNGVVEVFTKSGSSAEKVEDLAPQPLPLQRFRVAPNPTSGELRVRFKGEALPTTLRILSLSGQELLQRPLPGFDGQADETLDLGNLPKGTVLLEVRQGDRVYVEKVVLK